MSIVTPIYPDPRRSLARESARCRRSPLPRRSLPVDVVDDLCEPSVFEETRLEPLRKAPANADSRLSGFGFDPVRKPNICPRHHGQRARGRQRARVRFMLQVLGQRPHDRQGITRKLDDVPAMTFREVNQTCLLELSSESLELCGTAIYARRPTRRSRAVSALQITTPATREGPPRWSLRGCQCLSFSRVLRSPQKPTGRVYYL